MHVLYMQGLIQDFEVGGGKNKNEPISDIPLVKSFTNSLVPGRLYMYMYV